LELFQLKLLIKNINIIVEIGYYTMIYEVNFKAQFIMKNSHIFSSIFLNNDIGLWEWNIQSGELFLNERWASIIGYTLEELEPISIHSWETLSHPDDLIRSDKSIRIHTEGLSEYYECEVRIRHKNGHWVWIQDRGKIISYTEDGKPHLMVGYHQDITHRKESEELLHSNQILLRNIIDEMPDVFLLKDAKGNFLLCNQSVAKLYNSTPEEMIGKNDGDFGVPKEIADEFLQNVLSIMQKGETEVIYEDSRDAQTGEVRHFRSIKKPLKDHFGNDQILVIAQDVTEIINAHKKIAENERRLAEVLEATKEGIWDWNILTKHVTHNARWYKILGFNENEVANTVEAFAAQIHPQDITVVWEQLQNVLNGTKTSYYSEHRMIRKDGSMIWVQDRGKVVEFDDENRPVRIIGSCSDITRRKEYEESLKLSSNVFTHAREGIIITDAEGTIINVNEAFSDITGYSHEEAVGKNPRFLKSDRHDSLFYARLWNDIVAYGYWNGEIWNRTKEGKLFVEMLNISAVKNDKDSIQYYVSLFSDITAQKEHESELEHIANFDTLTGLPNRLLLTDRLAQAINHSNTYQTSVAICYIDLDGFKAVNDSYGHNIGDELLKIISQRMQQALRSEDTLARLGGDEFIAIIQCEEEFNTKDLFLNRLLKATSLPIIIDNLTLDISASIGVTFYPQEQEIDADQLFRQADYAMYQAKVSGKNCYHFFDMENDLSIRDHHKLLHEIKEGVANSEFVLFYQPKINLITQKPVGMEALIRWNHPKKGLLAPSFFLSEIDTHPLGITIGEWVIQTALERLEALQLEGIELPISVNITAYHFQQMNFVERLHKLLAAHPMINPKLLEMEVLETNELNDVSHVLTIMEECNKLGIQFSLDDFGTGFSSLSYLKRLPVHTIKIDQSFVRDMLTDQEDAKIIRGIMGLANTFEREVIAEGIECEEHAKALLELGCIYGQGYAIARPMPSDQINGWLRG
jgi:diguanylate cyclase (GGDEF)-like protein/PAS domain S-box-containing protein